MGGFNKNPDRPIVTTKEDRFGRTNFAIALAEAAVKVPKNAPFAVALYGPWGSGKTSIINLATEHIEKKYKDKVVCVTFNPWLFSSVPSLHLAFFSFLASKLGKKLKTGTEQLGEDLEKYGALTTPVLDAASTVVPWLTVGAQVGRLGKFFGRRLKGSPDVEALRERVNEQLKEANKRVVVVIDDIDRLDSEEVQQLFKLVKNTAHFNNITYLLSFDPEVVSEALSQRYPKSKEFGANFIDKIVQLSLYVPHVDQSLLDNYLFDYIQQVMDKQKIDVKEEDVADFQSIYYREVDELFDTPRKIVRYVNAIDFSLEQLKFEVHFSDLLYVDLIRLYYPRLYRVITENKNIVIGQGAFSDRDPNAKDKIAKELFGDNPPTAEETFLLTSLFPPVAWVFGGSSYDLGSFIPRWEKEKRVCTEKYFGRYFAYDIPPGDISDRDIDALLELCGRSDAKESEVVESLNQLVSKADPKLVVSKLRRHETDLPEQASINLSKALVAVGSNQNRRPDGWLGDTFSPYVQSAIIIANLAKRVSNKYEFIKEMMDKARLDFAGEIFKWVRAFSDEGKEDAVVTNAQVDELGTAVAERISKEAQTKLLLTDYGDQFTLLMWSWSKWGYKADIGKYFERLIKKPDNVVAFLMSYLGQAYDLLSGKKTKSEFRREAYNAVAELTDPEKFVKPLVKKFGDDVNKGDVSSIGFEENLPYDFQVARQFLALHRHVQAEQTKKVEGEVVSEPEKTT